MDERSNRYLLLITALVIGVLTLAVLAIEQTPLLNKLDKAKDIWPLGLSVTFNVIVLLAAAVIAVGYFEWAPLIKFLGLGIACKAVLTLLTAVGYVFTSEPAAFADHVREAALGSLVASVVHAVGVLVLISWALRDLVMGRQVGIGTPPVGIILPTEDEARPPEHEHGPAPLELEPAAGPEVTAAPVPADEVAPSEAAEAQQGVEEEDLDRVVATAAPVTADLEALPDQPPVEPEGEAAEPEELAEPEPALPEIASVADEEERPEPRPDEVEPAPASLAEITGETIRFSVEEILGCFRPGDVALSADEVRGESGEDNVRVPLDVVLPQIEEGAVRIDPDIVFSQLPRRTFGRSAEEIKGHLWQGRLQLPLDRVIAQVPPRALVRSYSAEQPVVAEFGEPFTDSLLERSEQPAPAVPGCEPAPAVEPEPQPAGVSPVAAVEELEPALVHEPESALGPTAAAPVEGIAAVPSAAAAHSASLPATLRVNAEYVVAQFPSEAMAMPIEDIEAKLRPHGKLLVPVDDVLSQLAKGYVAIDVTQLLEQLPSGAVAMSWSDVRDALPGGKVRLPLDDIVRQLPRDVLALGITQRLQEAADEIPEPFHDATAPPPVEEPEAHPAGPGPAEIAAAEPSAAPTPEQAAEPGRTLAIAWRDLLPQFPADAFSVSRDQLATALEGKSAHIDMHLIRSQLSEGHLTVPCGYLLAQFPDEYLDLSVEQIAERMPEARFELPLVSVILQLPEEELAPPAEQTRQESTDGIPTIFVDSIAQAAEAPKEAVEEPEPAEAAEEAAPAPEETAPEPALADAEADDLTQKDIDEIESMLDEKRRDEPEPGDDGEFLDELVDTGEDEEEPLLAAPVLEPEPAAGEEPAPEAEEATFLEPEEETVPAEVETVTGEEAEPTPDDTLSAAEVQEQEELVEELLTPEAEQVGAPAEEWSAPEEIPAAFVPPGAEHEVEAPPVRAVGPSAAGLDAAAHRDGAFRGLLHEYARFHVEHGHVCVEGGQLVFAFTPAETSAEALALELPPRLAAFEQLLRRAGCGPLERAVLTAGTGSIVCQWLPETRGNALAMIATTDKQAAGMMHLQVKRDAATLSALSARLWSGPAQGTTAPRGAAPTGAAPPAGTAPCEVVRPRGGPCSEIARLLAAFNIRTIAQLRFGSGAQWMLASSLDLDDAAVSGQACYNPSHLAKLPESLRLGRIESVLAVAGGHVVTLNAPDRAGEPGLICIFPSEFREGLLRMKADKASAIL